MSCHVVWCDVMWCSAAWCDVMFVKKSVNYTVNVYTRACVIVRVRSCTYECMYERRCECVGYPPMIVHTPVTCVSALPFCLLINPTGLSVFPWCDNMRSPTCEIAPGCFGAHPAPVPAAGQPGFHGLAPCKTPCAHRKFPLHLSPLSTQAPSSWQARRCRSAEKQGMQHAQQVGIASVPC